MKHMLAYSIILFLFLLTGCFSSKDGKSTQIKKIFSFPIGYDKEELGVLPEKIPVQASLNFCYNNGFYYISDRINNKVLKVTETGVIVLTIYNQKNYPYLLSNTTDTTSDNYEYLKRYASFPLEQPGAVAADIEKSIYVVNRDPLYKKQGEQNQIEDEFILKFDSRGNFLYRIGKNGTKQTGIAGEIEPFNYISKIGTDINRNLIVMEGYSNDLTIYKFSDNGKLLQQTALAMNKLPLSKSESNGITLLIDAMPGYLEDEILAVYQFVSREMTNSIELFQLEYEKIFRYNLKEEKFDKMLLKTSPEYEDLSKLKFDPAVIELYGDMKKIQLPMPTFIGCDSYSNIYLYQEKLPLDSLVVRHCRVMKYNENGRLENRRMIQYNYDIIYNSQMHLTPKGRILNYVIKENEVTFVSVNG